MGTRNPIGGPFRRRVRRPIPLAQRRPVRWIEGNSAIGTEPLPAVSAFAFTPTLDTSLWPTAGGTELVFGDDDLDWMDANEATIERVVGDIDVTGFFIHTGSSWHLSPFVRMGMLLVQETEDISTWVPPSLWDREAIEEYEWMWLWQSHLVPINAPVPLSSLTTPGGEQFINYDTPTVHVDLRVRRKVGKKDHLVLLGQFGLGAGIDGDIGISATHLLRVLFKTK